MGSEGNCTGGGRVTSGSIQLWRGLTSVLSIPRWKFVTAEKHSRQVRGWRWAVKGFLQLVSHSNYTKTVKLCLFWSPLQVLLHFSSSKPVQSKRANKSCQKGKCFVAFRLRNISSHLHTEQEKQYFSMLQTEQSTLFHFSKAERRFTENMTTCPQEHGTGWSVELPKGDH